MGKQQSNQRALANEAKLLRRLNGFIKEINIDNSIIKLHNLHIHTPTSAKSSSANHTHSFIEIHTIMKGSVQVIANNKKYTAVKGQLVVHSPFQVHYWKSLEQPLLMHIWWLEIKRPEEKQLTEIDWLMNSLWSAKSVVYKLPHDYEFNYNRIIEELKHHELCYQAVIEKILSEIVVSLSRSTMRKKRRKSLHQVEEAEERDKIIAVINHFLQDNIARTIRLADIQKCVYMSERNVLRYYKKVTGMTIGQKLSRLRMYHAEELIRQTDLPMKVISAQCGITDSSYFPRLFRKFYDLSPTQYRQKFRSKYKTKKQPFKADKSL